MRDRLPRIEEESNYTTPGVKPFHERDTVYAPRRLEVGCEWSLSSGRRERLEASVLRQQLHEQSINQIPKARKTGACSPHHLEEA